MRRHIHYPFYFFLFLITISISVSFSASMVSFSASLNSHASTSIPDPLTGIDLKTGLNLNVPTKFTDKKALVLVFMSAKCPCSHSHIDEIAALRNRHKDFQFYIVHSNVNEDLESTKRYFSSLDIPITVIQDTEAKIADLFSAYKTPHAFIINQKGEIIYKGGVTNSNTAQKADKHYLDQALLDLENKNSIATPETKALGCFISREKD